jgi:carboxyl-terminal processing protease
MMKNRTRYRRLRFFIFLWFGLTTSLSCRLATFPTPPPTIPVSAKPNFELIAEAWNAIERIYVDRSAVDSRRMTYGAISGMVDSLGDTGHSRFLTPEMVKQEHLVTRGELEGIGAELRTKNNQAVIVAPMDDSPAQRAGLKPGDIILKVDGKDVAGLPLEQVVSRILGPPGTSVKLGILHPGTGRTFDVDLVRARITIRSITWHRLPGTAVAHLRLAIFSKGVTRDLRKELIEIEARKMTGLILDLRNNPGGLFQEAVSTASQFLQDGNVVLERDSLGKARPVHVSPGGLARSIPMVALVNGGTSSGAEIVAGALQDGRRAKLVGEKTFGTGTVLQEFPLTDGSALMLAIEEWLTPAGHEIWHRGIVPDLVVSLPLQGELLLPVMEREMTAAQLKVSSDTQLLRALELLVPEDYKP